MNILLFGVSNVGKSVSGRLLADHLNYTFYDLDDEVKKDQNTTLEKFVSTGTLLERDSIRCHILNQLVYKAGNKVIAVSPLSHIQNIVHLFSSPDAVCIELTDSAENIFDRLLFSDENDIIYKDDDYKNRHKDHYLEEILEDLDWYGTVYSDIKNIFDFSGMTPEEAVPEMIDEFHLSEDMEV